MADSQKPQLGDYATARKVVHGDHRDEGRDEGVVVGLPKNKQGYYDILSPYHSDKPFQGHIDDAEVVPDDQLSQNELDFKEEVNRGLKGDT